MSLNASPKFVTNAPISLIFFMEIFSQSYILSNNDLLNLFSLYQLFFPQLAQLAIKWSKKPVLVLSDGFKLFLWWYKQFLTFIDVSTIYTALQFLH